MKIYIVYYLLKTCIKYLFNFLKLDLTNQKIVVLKLSHIVMLCPYYPTLKHVFWSDFIEINADLR